MARRMKSNRVVAAGQKLAMVLPPSRLALGGPPTSSPAMPPLPLSPWHIEHLSAKILAPSAALPLPAGRLLPSGRTLMSHGARSAGVIGLPRLGPSASAMPAPHANASMPAPIASLRIDMFDLSLGVHGPTGDGVEMLAREAEHRWGLRSLAAQRHELFPGRLHVAGLVPGPALQDRRPAVPPPRHAEAGEGLGQPRLLERRLRPALAAVRRHHHLGDAAGAGIGDAGNLVDAGLLELEAGRRVGDEGLH